MTVPCRLCGRPVAGADGRAGDVFCCDGCARVFDVLSHLDPEAGTAYLEAARRLGVIPGEPEAGAPDLPADPVALRDERFRMDGLACPSCAWVAEQVLAAQPGVASASVDFLTGTGTVRYDLRVASADRLTAALDRLGYRMGPVEDEAGVTASRRLTVAFVLAAVLTMNLMSLSAVRYARDLGWLSEVPVFLPWLELGLCLPVFAVGWVPAVRRAAAALRRGRATMDLLVALSAGAAFALSCAALVTGRDDIYFETAAGLVTIALLSRAVEARLRDRAFRRTALLLRMDVARVRVPGEGPREAWRPVAEVRPGDVVLVDPGEIVPFDGEVLEGQVRVSEAVLTGEPAPLLRTAGDPVPAGARVEEGRLRLGVRRPFAETGLARVTAALRETLARGEGRLRAADRVAAAFVPAVLAVAGGAWAVRWAMYGAPYAWSPEGWFPSVAVLAVACPCAFSLAGVAALTAVTGACLDRGLLVRDPAGLEVIPRVRSVVFDKTGTLSEGRIAVDRVAWLGPERPDLLPHVLAAEHGAGHPVAAALRAFLHERGVPDFPPEAEIEDLPGLGRRMALEGRSFAVGAAGLFVAPREPEGTPPGATLAWFGLDGEAAGCFVLADPVRPDAATTVAALKSRGLRVDVLSGDRPEATATVARAIGADAAEGGATLEVKVARIRAREAAGDRILYVGDGTNDALAMAEATASLAVAGSTDEALAAADVVALHGRLDAVPAAVDAARRLTRTVRGNYAWAATFNLIFVPVAATGALRPLVAMLLMLLSSLGVLANSLRAARRA